ncbi:CBS domain-containing protein [Candidatus Woesearchaeota archaeon]|nr:MAG: CBS domain-containing protein [Candidatus Woesearchaeota archaeon]
MRDTEEKEKVKHWMRRNPVTIGKNRSVKDAAAIMDAHGIGTLVVVDEEEPDKPLGVFTERDILRQIVKMDINPANVEVGTFMSRELVLEEEDSTISDAMRKMHRQGVKRMPVVDSEGKLAGILTKKELMKKLAEEIIDSEKGMMLKKMAEPYLGELSGIFILRAVRNSGFASIEDLSKAGEEEIGRFADNLAEELSGGKNEQHAKAIRDKVKNTLGGGKA